MMEETDIQIIIDRVTFLLKMELNKCNVKYKESIKETSEGILNLPIVKKVIHEYETKISHDTSSENELNRLKNMVSNLTSEIQDIKKMLLLNQKTVLNEKTVLNQKTTEEPNIQLKIREINNDESLGIEILKEEELDNVSELALSEAKSEEEEEEEEEDEEEEEEDEEEDHEEEDHEVKEEEEDHELKEDEEEDHEVKEDEAISEVKEDEEDHEVKEDEEDEDEEVFEIEIDDTTYFTNNEENGVLYEIDENGEPGKKVGIIKDGEAIFS